MNLFAFLELSSLWERTSIIDILIRSRGKDQGRTFMGWSSSTRWRLLSIPGGWNCANNKPIGRVQFRGPLDSIIGDRCSLYSARVARIPQRAPPPHARSVFARTVDNCAFVHTRSFSGEQQVILQAVCVIDRPPSCYTAKIRICPQFVAHDNTLASNVTLIFALPVNTIRQIKRAAGFCVFAFLRFAFRRFPATDIVVLQSERERLQ